MFYLEDEKTLVLTSENKKDILSALKLINNISNNKNIKVAYIKILGKVLEFNKAIENYYHSQKPGYNEVYQERIDNFDNSSDEFKRIKASLKPDFDDDNFVEELEKEFNLILNRIESRISIIWIMIVLIFRINAVK